MINKSLVITCFFSAQALAAVSPGTPEMQALRMSRNLRPISDEQWKSIAGERSPENYEIVRGDTLYDVSQRFFGDGKYWPKIWAINNGRVLNPHLIYPGNRIAFNPGSGSTLPSIDVTGVAIGTTTIRSDSGTTVVETKKRSQEWKTLPPQRWEQVALKPSQEVDPLGFDRRSKIVFKQPTGTTLKFVVREEDYEPVGTIKNAKTMATSLSIGEQVFIENNSNLQVGEEYAVVPPSAYPLLGSTSGAGAYAYENMGTVLIKGVRGSLFLGEVTQAYGSIQRGHLLVPKIERVPELDPIPGPEAIEASVTLDPTNSTFLSSQLRYVFIDRGSREGIAPGMVFRSYQREDPNLRTEFTDSNIVRETDFMVMQVTTNFSVAYAINGVGTFQTNNPAFLLTDVGEVARQMEGGIQPPPEGELDQLDQLDSGSELSEEEKRELEQLENYQGEGEPPPAEGTEEMVPPEQDAGVEMPGDEIPTAEGTPEVPLEELPPPTEIPPAENPPAEEMAPPGADDPLDIPPE
jgi:hypothetical protein